MIDEPENYIEWSIADLADTLQAARDTRAASARTCFAVEQELSRRASDRGATMLADEDWTVYLTQPQSYTWDHERLALLLAANQIDSAPIIEFEPPPVTGKWSVSTTKALALGRKLGFVFEQELAECYTRIPGETRVKITSAANAANAAIDGTMLPFSSTLFERKPTQ